jgi:maleate isomerase
MATDVLGWRRLYGVIGPSTNTVVQPDYDAMRPRGVTNHHSRIFTPDATAISDATFMAATELISGNVVAAVRSVMTCRPQRLVMGMSAITFYGGAAGADAFARRLEAEAGVPVTIGAHACTAALAALGGIRRIALLTPYYPVANAEVRRYFADHGIETVRDVALRCPSWTAIAQVTEDRCRTALRGLDGPDVDAMVQVGTNLSMLRLADEAERWLGKPVVAINAATYWHALRADGITVRMDGFGSLLAAH